MYRNFAVKNMAILMALLILLTTGCATTQVGQKASTDLSPPSSAEIKRSEVASTGLPKPEINAVQEEYQPYISDMNDLRLDLSAVLQAMYYRLAGSPSQAMGPVHFADDVGPLSDDTHTSFTGFALVGISVRADLAASEDPLHRRVKAILKLADAMGRQAFFKVAADYLIGADIILIRQAAIIPYYPRTFDVRFLVIPEGRLPSLKFLKGLPLSELFRIASENALDREDLSVLKGSETGHYKLLALNMVRGLPEDQLKIYISDREAAGRATSSDRISLNDNGWAAAVVTGSFQFNSTPAYTFHVGIDREETVIPLRRFQSVILE